MRKLLAVFGLLGALFAAEGLNRVASLVNAFNGADGPIYSALMVVSIVAAGALLVSLFARVSGWVKWPLFLALAAGSAAMLAAPSFGANMQALVGLGLSALGVLAINSAAGHRS
jgi:hypothetical protein